MEPIIKGYVTANAGFVRNTSKDFIPNVTLGAGGIISKNGYYGQIEGGYGTAGYAKVEAGKNLTFGESKFGLNTSVGGQYTISNRKQDYYSEVFEDGNNSPTWKPNDLRGYGNVALTYHNSVVDMRLGVRGGVKTSTQPSLDDITLADVGITRGTEYAGRTTKGFVTPTFNLEVGKKFRFKLDASLDNFSIGGKYYF